MSQSYYGSVCLTDMLEKAKVKHPAVSKGKNGKIYVNINIWLNDQPDEYGNIMAIQLSEKKDQKVGGKSFYLGNCKKSTTPEITDRDTDSLELPNDIPERTNAAKSNSTSEIQDDSPF